eukprot:5581173-Ditylum_brightwellii.AAC.1
MILPESSVSKQYSQAEFFPAKKAGINSIGTAARNPYEPMHRWNTSPPTPAIVPYASVCVSHESQQKVSKHLITASTSEYVPMHRWNTSPPVPATNSICNLTDGIDFNKPFLSDSSGDNHKKMNFLP